MTSSSTPSEPKVNPKLRSLRPEYEEAKHGRYVSLMMEDITGDGPSLNVAISGAYGSGKSSILDGLLDELGSRNKLGSKKRKSMQVTLATLNQSRKALLDVSGEDTLTSALEKEIVKRLLYAAKPKKIPRSRFNRISGFRFWSSAGLAAVISLLVLGTALTFGAALPPDQLVAKQEWSGWLGPALDFASVWVLAMCGQAALSSFRLSQIAVGPAALSLDYKDGNYFDHFLDEIIYFFQRTKVRVVLFEDLDRFNDPGIFLALRELNNLLNNSPQIKKSVTFVYAIRDSLFVKAVESAEQEAETTKKEVDRAENEDASTEEKERSEKSAAGLPDAHARHGSDSAASDRAKFFDLIVPVVPFISHEVSADLLLGALDDLAPRLKLSSSLVTLAGRHFTDMRVILSIRNEFEVFASELLEESAVPGLEPDQLFAMVVYKHLRLDDFEKIRTGESQLDAAVDGIRRTTDEMVSVADKAIADVENSIEVGLAVDRRAELAGDRLLPKLDLFAKERGWDPISSVSIEGSADFSREQVRTRDFWEALAESPDSQVTLHSAGAIGNLKTADLEVLLEQDKNPKGWIRSSVVRDRQRLKALEKARSWLRNAPISELLSGPFPLVSLDEDHRWSLVGSRCRRDVGGGLPYELLRAGCLDQNFALYTTKFHGAILSAEGRSFMMRYADRHQSAPLFKLTPADIDQILDRLGASFLDDPSSLNVDIVDHLLEDDAGDLPALIEEPGQAEEFLLTYLANGTGRDALLLHIASKRGDILDIVASASSLSDADRRQALSISLSVLSNNLEYELDSSAQEVLSQNLDQLPILQEELEYEVAAAIAKMMSANELIVSDLSQVAEPLRTEIGRVGSFSINGANLQSLTDEEGAVGLDTLGGLEGGVGRRLIEKLPEYLGAVREVTNGSIVDESANIDKVVRAIFEHDPESLGESLELITEGIAYDDLALAPELTYPELAKARVFVLNRNNVTLYIESVGGIDPALAAWLTEAKEISSLPTDNLAEDERREEEAARQALAAEIVTTGHVDSAVKTPLVVSLKARSTLGIDDLELDDPDLAAELLSSGRIADDITTFTSLAEGPWPVFEACAVESSNFSSVVEELTFTDGLLAGILESKRIPVEIRRSLLKRFDALQPVLETASATAWISAALRLRTILSVARLTTLAQRGAKSGQLVSYLKSGRTRMTAEELSTILTYCDKPYSRLGVADGSKFTVPFGEDLRPILESLKNGGSVKGFKKKRGRDLFEVQMAGPI